MEELKYEQIKKGRRNFKEMIEIFLQEEVRNFSFLCSCKLSLKYAQNEGSVILGMGQLLY